MRYESSPYLRTGLFLALLATLFGTVFYDAPAMESDEKGFVCGTGMAADLPMPPAPPPPPPPPKPEVEKIFGTVERMPLFPGCDAGLEYAERKACADKKMLEFVYGNIKYPPEAIAAGVEGMVVISFVVEKNGKVSEAKIVRDPGAGTGTEALRVVNLMTAKGLNFDPMSSNGRTVRVQYNLPVKFKLE